MLEFTDILLMLSWKKKVKEILKIAFPIILTIYIFFSYYLLKFIETTINHGKMMNAI